MENIVYPYYAMLLGSRGGHVILDLRNISVITLQETTATRELHLASRGLTVHCARRIASAVPNSARGDRREVPSRGRVCSLPGVVEKQDIPVSLQLGFYQCIYLLQLYSAVLL